ncbi:DUF6118 family protein [Hephaestia mangrovi]|uniref:DUF6118 family protein n=1 Tax=Hephaestia mangrovi TaxID=2873268 RepID=UPI001CA6E4DD|nr:DUF6118 family protein [Hephaestia mangrovi]MBY8826580.1 DUF6118 family protein [Hephaestia mangrovi]
MPTPAPEADPAARAFTRLAEKVDLLEAAIAGLAAKREAVPNYSETLGEIAVLLGKMREAIKTLAVRPAMTLTPDNMARQIAAAGETARAADRATINQARDRIDKVASHMERLVGTVATVRDQRRRLLWVASGGALGGMLIWSIMPGVILRALPQGWHMPEAMAAHVIGEPTLWEAGTRLMRADSPNAWDALTHAAELLADNRRAIDKCTVSASKTGKPARCVINVAPDPQRR